ncbi:IclR family transcriptional regulator [Bacillus sp. FSL K6-3431]|uniref:IclR family transcriptional regulator n=1 Tax=Bacillus sp. FSL K6-3431 TaxID=2921500 RepID=UPI0030FB4CED
MENKKPLYGAVLLKADQILEYLSSSETSKKLNEIAKGADLTNSTALKILDTLVVIGYVQKDAETKRFSLGPSIIKYANKSINQLDIKQIAKPYLQKLQRITTETVHLGILDHVNIVYITKMESSNPVSLYSKVGKSIPLYCSAMGKSILADQSDEEVQMYLANNSLIKKTANTITTKETFIQEIAQIRELGYALDNSEHEDEVFCVGASITLHGENFGAFSVSVPKYRITDVFRNEIIQLVQQCKADIISDL